MPTCDFCTDFAKLSLNTTLPGNPDTSDESSFDPLEAMYASLAKFDVQISDEELAKLNEESEKLYKLLIERQPAMTIAMQLVNQQRIKENAELANQYAMELEKVREMGEKQRIDQTEKHQVLKRGHINLKNSFILE